MSVTRPEVMDALGRWREVIWAAALAGAGVWLIWLGGYVLRPLGIVLAALAIASAVIAARRLRFQRAVDAPGVVEVDEGQVGYLGPSFGGYLSLRELVEIRLIDLQGHRHWRLKQADGQALIIPVAAAGAGALYDAFAALPGIDMGDISRALDAPAALAPLWQRGATLASAAARARS